MKTFSNSPPKVCNAAHTMLPTAPSSSLTDEWLDSPKAAQFLKVTEAQLRNLVSNRVIPSYKLGGSLRYSRNELDAHLRKSRRG